NLNRAGITSLASDTFEDLGSLKKLNLGGAGITSLEAGTFSGLQALVDL
ncbi:unnamed protein product, partial [Ectocarpus fasciculatus]